MFSSLRPHGRTDADRYAEAIAANDYSLQSDGTTLLYRVADDSITAALTTDIDEETAQDAIQDALQRKLDEESPETLLLWYDEGESSSDIPAAYDPEEYLRNPIRLFQDSPREQFAQDIAETVLSYLQDD